ncbi:MAG: ATP-binding cassette domain-containing protein [Nitrososphaerota archaeon]|nr:ATP-binding cassette domain-containing protein [Nitrososphaerota archaeon]
MAIPYLDTQNIFNQQAHCHFEPFVIDVRATKTLGEFSMNVEIKDEGMICLIGNNGSGKTTLLNLIAGVSHIDSGYIRIDSTDITSVQQEKRNVVLVMPDSAIPNFEVERHLVFGANLKRLPLDQLFINEVKTKLGVTFSGRVSQLSLGMKERVALATALIAKPKAILVDEAFSNIDNKSEFIENYRELAASSNIDILYSTQHSEDSNRADHIYRMESGRALRER